MRGAVFTRGEIGRLQASIAGNRRRPGRRFAFGPVMVWGGWTTLTAAEVLGVHPRQVSRWLAAGVSVELADVLACRVCGVHPVGLWADWFDGVLDECEGVAA